MMRVAVNLAWLAPGRAGGSEEYTTRLLAAVIDELPADVEIRVVGQPELFDAYPVLAGVECVAVPGPVRFRPWRVAAESTAVHAATRGFDIVHHFGGRVPARHHGNDIVTIHDLQPVHRPENFSAAKRRYLGWALPRSVRAARLVVGPSEWVVSTIVETFGVAAHSVRAVSSTWDSSDEVDPRLADSLAGDAVVLYPAVTHPHKRHTLLLEAMARVVAQGCDATLVLTGGAGRADAAVRAAIERSPVRVVGPGRVPAAVLRGLYRRADVVAFPSSYEGFGLPVLEAMRAGVPLVAADTTALPEVIGDAGVLLRGDDPGTWGDAILSTLGGGPDVDARIARARTRVDAWSPHRAARRLVDAWRSAA